MPTLLPRRAGFTTTRAPSGRRPRRARRGRAPRSRRCGGTSAYSTTGSPWPRMRSLKTTLSMATALASTPAPVYGMPASSRKPWSVPSSPNGPWTTRKATSIASASERTAARGARRSSPRGDRPASGPHAVRRRATSSLGLAAPTRPASEVPSPSCGAGPSGSMPAPFAIDVDEVRLEAIAVDRAQHRLGRRHAHLVLGRPASGEDADPQPGHAFGLRVPRRRRTRSRSASSTPNRSATVGAHVVAERPDVGGAAAAVGDDEVRVEVLTLRAAEPVALQAGGLDEPPGMVVRVGCGRRCRRSGRPAAGSPGASAW